MARRRRNRSGEQQARGGTSSAAVGMARVPAAFPPQINANTLVRKTVRYSAAASGSGGVNFQALRFPISALGGLAASTTVLYPIVEAVKLLRITIWSPAVEDTTAHTWSGQAAVKWHGLNNYNPGVMVQDQSLSNSRPACVSVRPPPGSDASFWLSTNDSQDLCQLIFDKGATVDVDMICAVCFQGSPSPVYPVSGVITGVMYGIPLDGSTDILRNVSLPFAT